MGVSWTEEQQKVIDLRDRSILVSAAAGSGKTAVLVERILGKITDKHHPVDIDRMLIMTFTRAAAGEMKERIAAALEQALYENPDDAHLQRQMTLIHTAQITTIHGFCSYVIRNYFHRIGLDPKYRLADEGEIRLMKEEVAAALLEDAYAEGSDDFLRLVECACPGRDDNALREMILKLYEAAISDPEPEEWLRHCTEGYHFSEGETLWAKPWAKDYLREIREDLLEAISLQKKGLALCEGDGPMQYQKVLIEDMETTNTLWQTLQKGEREDTDPFPAFQKALLSASFGRMPGKVTATDGGDLDDQKKELAKACRAEAKEVVDNLKKSLGEMAEEEILAESGQMAVPLGALANLTISFMERFAAAKREMGILDFSDLEHLALQILRERDENGYQPSEAARELASRYDEVMVDEYQDSNLVQEWIATYVSKLSYHKDNVFMVGDVKQSIYRFRQARPELFMEKYKSYSTEGGTRQRIDLSKNFRSRAAVLSGVNYLFRQLMGEDLGGIDYDKAAALYPGASYPEGEKESYSTELLLFPKEDESLLDEGEKRLSGKDERQLEALMIAKRIRQLVGVQKVFDKETKALRPARYGDIVILLRSFAGWGETFVEELSAQGIPVYAASRTGYFSATEVVTVLNYLQICENPLQDAALAGVLHSPIVGCSAEELAILRIESPEGCLYEAVKQFLENRNPEAASTYQCTDEGTENLLKEARDTASADQMIMDAQRDHKKEQGETRQAAADAMELQVLYDKLRQFHETFQELREIATYTPIHQFIQEVLNRTGYGCIARALPDGEQRSANLSMLIEKAMEYEKTNFKGLFHFVRYIENLRKYEVDFGEVNLSGAGENSVQLMTIHKSKGLEFPIVFVSGLGKQFNFMDTNAALLLHPELGIGMDYIDPEQRIKRSAIQKQVIRSRLLQETLGEELRVLYVALTRAKEKLILTGTIGDEEKLFRKISCHITRDRELLPVAVRRRARSYLDYILPALSGHRSMQDLFASHGILERGEAFLSEDESEFLVRIVQPKELVFQEAETQLEHLSDRAMLENWDPSIIRDNALREEIDRRFSYRYPYEALAGIPVKVSISELKKRSMHEDAEREEALFDEPLVTPYIPRFMRENLEEEEKRQYTGSDRGTAYHRVMECLDYAPELKETEIRAQIESLVTAGKLTEKQAECVQVQDILAFLRTPLGKRMEAAGKAGLLMREQPFMIEQPAKELSEKWDADTGVLVQGIIDAYFLEGEDIILVDYKTDRVAPGEANRLVELYHVQLEGYARALERMTQKTVRETYIYSFTLSTEIPLHL